MTTYLIIVGDKSYTVHTKKIISVELSNGCPILKLSSSDCDIFAGELKIEQLRIYGGNISILELKK